MTADKIALPGHQPMTQCKFDKDYYFGSVYSDYDGFLNWGKVAKDLIKRFEFNSFLDIGCGCGNLVKEIKKQLEGKRGKSSDICGVDISVFAVEQANVPFVSLADCKSLPFEDRRFDLVHILGTFSYLSNLSGIKQSIKESYRVSRKIIIFDDVYTVPDKKSDDYDPYRKHILSRENWLSLWKEAIGRNDTIETYKEEIIVKNYET